MAKDKTHSTPTAPLCAAPSTADSCTSVALLQQTMVHITNTVNNISTKVDTVIDNLDEGNLRFKDIEHTQVLMDLRIKAIEATHAQSSATKQSIFMMFIDKGIGVLLPWAAVAYMLYGKTP